MLYLNEIYSIAYITGTTEFHLIQRNDTTPLKTSTIVISDTVENISWALGRRKGVSRIAIGRRVRRDRVPRVALYCGLSRFRNFALWCRFGRADEQGRYVG